MSDVLIGDGEVEAIFASFRKNDSERVGGEVLKFVHIEVEWTSDPDVGNNQNGTWQLVEL